MPRIISIFDIDLNKDHQHREISTGDKTRKILYPECIGIIFLTFRKIKIVTVNLIEFCRSKEKVNKLTDTET